MASSAAMIEVPINDPVQDGPAGGISERCAAASLRFASPEGFGVWDILFIVVLANVYALGCIPWGISFKQVSSNLNLSHRTRACCHCWFEGCTLIIKVGNSIVLAQGQRNI